MLWADGKFRHTTTVVHRRYIKSDDGRPAMEESHLRQYVNTRDRITQTLCSEASASELDEDKTRQHTQQRKIYSLKANQFNKDEIDKAKNTKDGEQVEAQDTLKKKQLDKRLKKQLST